MAVLGCRSLVLVIIILIIIITILVIYARDRVTRKAKPVLGRAPLKYIHTQLAVCLHKSTYTKHKHTYVQARYNNQAKYKYLPHRKQNCLAMFKNAMHLITKLRKEIEFQTNKVFTLRNIDKSLIEESIIYKYIVRNRRQYESIPVRLHNMRY